MAAMASANAESLLVKIPEGARLLGLGESTLYALIKRGELGVVRINGATRIARSELHRFVQRRSQSGEHSGDTGLS